MGIQTIKRNLSALAFVSSTIVSAEAFAQNADPEELDLVKLLNVQVSTATKTSENLDDAPAVITVVTREDIHRWGYRSVAEVLSHCLGFYIIDDHILPNAGVRGITGGLGAESGVIKVMIDGRSVAYRTTSGNWLGVELIPLESVKQIEIIRGPASALYGADAFLGVVNIITETPDDLRPLRARGSIGVTGDNPSGQFDLVGAAKAGRFDFMLGAAGEYGSRSGLVLPPESPAPTLPAYVGTRREANNLDRRSLVLQARVGYRVPDTGHVIVSGYLSGIERGGDFAHWAQLTNAQIGGRTFGTIVALQQMRFNFDGLLHVARHLDFALLSTYSRGGVLPQDRVEIGSELFYIKRNTSYQALDSTLEARWTPHERFNAIVGLEGVYDAESLPAPQRFNRLTDTPLAGSLGADQSVNLVNLGAYLSSNLKIIDPWLKLTGGIRYDNNSQYGSQVTGRVGITSRWSKTLVAKLLYGSAFKAPSPYLLYATPLRPGDVQGNANLLPQHVDTAEYQMSWRPSVFFNATSGVSYNAVRDQAEFTPQGINQSARNIASQTSFTWETRLEAKHYEDFTAYLSAELIESQRNLGQEGYVAQLVGTSAVAYPPYIGRAGLSVGVPFIRTLPLEVVAEGMLVGPRHASDASVVENGAPFDLPPYFLLNLSIATRELYLIPGHESRIALRARNLTGSRGPDPGFSGFEYPLFPREVFLEFQHVY